MFFICKKVCGSSESPSDLTKLLSDSLDLIRGSVILSVCNLTVLEQYAEPQIACDAVPSLCEYVCMSPC